MKVIKIQTYRHSLIFSFQEQSELNTNLTDFTTKINLEELIFSFKYILKNKKLVTNVLKENILNKDINKITITSYDLLDVVCELMANIEAINQIEIKEKIVLTYKDCLKIANMKYINQLECYSIPGFMLDTFDKNNINVKLECEEFYVSSFMLDNKFNNYADMYYAKTVEIDRPMNEEDISDFKTFIEINRKLSIVYLYYYSKELVQDLLYILDSLNVKSIRFKIYQDSKNNETLKELAKFINRKKIKKLSYAFKIIYSREYINQNFLKQLSYTNLKMCSLIMIVTLLAGLGFKLYYDYSAQKDVEDLYEILDIDTDPNPDIVEGNEQQQADASEQEKVIEALTKDFDKLLAINSDTVGWLKVNNTNVNYPVVQTDNNEYYLNNNFYKRKNYNGWIFMDYRNSIETLNQNTIIYGHNGTMFGSLKKALKESWYTNSNNQIITLDTLYATLQFRIFAIYVTTPDFDYLVNNYIYPENYQKFIEEIKSRSIYDFGVDVTTNDKILTLSTCADSDGTKRIVIHAKLV